MTRQERLIEIRKRANRRKTWRYSKYERRDIGPLPERAWFWRDVDMLHLRVSRPEPRR